MMKKIYLIFCLLSTFLKAQQNYPALNFTLISKLDPETGTNPDGDKYSGCWGWYQADKKKEYAIACSQAGTFWVDMSNPATPSVSAYRSGARSGAIWREAKTYQNFCYVISDDNGSNSFQIFDMQYLPDSVVKVFDNTSLFRRGHTLWVDGNKLYVASVTYSNSTYSSMNVYSLANPALPVLLRSLKQDYPFITGVHDMFVRRDTIYASCEYQGLYIFKLTATNTFTQLGSLTTYTGAGYNHSSALTPDGKTLVFTDEIPTGLPIKIANVSNLQNIQVLATTNQFSMTTPHNPFIVNNQYCFMSSYEDGLQLLDIGTAASPSLVAYFDTYPQGGGNAGNWSNPYGGQWGCYPFLPSKTIFALDQANGLFFLKTNLYSSTSSTVSTVGMSAEEIASKVRIYPNPAKDHLRVDLQTGIQELFICDARGELVALPIKKEETQQDIDLSFFSQGLYSLLIVDKEGHSTLKKLVISRGYE